MMLEGPPGTGKTTTIVDGLLKKVISVYGIKPSDMYVLVSAPSNKAVQVLAIRFFNDDRNKNIPFIVVGVKDKLNPLLNEIFLQSWFPDFKENTSIILETLGNLTDVCSVEEPVQEIQTISNSYHHVLRKVERFTLGVFPENCKLQKDFEILGTAIMDDVDGIMNDNALLKTLIEAVQRIMIKLERISNKSMEERLLNQ